MSSRRSFPDSASHSALVNQCLNSASDDGSPRTLRRCPPSRVPKSGAGGRFVSMKEHQNRFNAGRFVERALAEGFVCCRREVRDIEIPGVEGLVCVATIGWRDQRDRFRFYAQCFWTATGDRLPGTYLDPKCFLGDDGIFYKLDSTIED